MSAPILVIEDNARNLYLLTFLLEAAGYTVIQAKDGPAGIALAQKSLPSMVILDIQLPTMNGYAVARELRACPGLERTPILAVTSYAMPSDRQRALEAGCTGYVEKPINPDTFVDQVRSFL